jgi:ferredoxin-NADP reductase/organic hydroperoxide reductase OsmC/OhrA
MKKKNEIMHFIFFPKRTGVIMPIHTIRLTGRQVIARNTMAFTFEKPKSFNFKAGQFGDITLINPPFTDAEGNTRGFSITSPPYGENLMIATRMRDTAFKRVLREMPLGMPVKWDAPYGSFTLHNNTAIPAVFLTGGIGITPVRSIALQAARSKLPHHISVFYSNNTPEDTAFLEELKVLEHENPYFKLIPTMTHREKSQQSWKGETDYINQAMLAKYLNNLTKSIYYVSGPPAMVAAMRKVLHALAVDDDNIRTEEFTGYESLVEEMAKGRGIIEEIVGVEELKQKAQEENKGQQLQKKSNFNSSRASTFLTKQTFLANKSSTQSTIPTRSLSTNPGHAEHHITLAWERSTSDFVYETYNRNASLTFSGGSKIDVSNPPHYFGDAKLANPEELLVSALSCCYMQTFLAVACKKDFIVNQYLDHATGISGRNEKGKNSVTEITLNPLIIFAEKQPDKETLHAMQEKAHENCFISNSIASKVSINIQPSLASNHNLPSNTKKN